MEFDEFEPWRKRMAEAFDRSGVEITKFSTEIGKNRDYVRRLIRDGTANPSPSLFIEICEKLGASPAYIISGEDMSSERDKVARKVLGADAATLRRISRAIDLFED